MYKFSKKLFRNLKTQLDLKVLFIAHSVNAKFF